MDRRVKCSMTGAHSGQKRLSGQQPSVWPELKAWRCALTALSHVYNLYFVACNDDIHVYQPSFPDQRLTSEPRLVISPLDSNSTGPGIDPLDPHSITRLHLDYLGQDEVLLVTCDDGDVLGYRVEEIQRVLDGPILPRHGEEPMEIRPFFEMNVGASAWGLAVHREARIIAISANTHKITVWMCALTQDGTEPVSNDSIPRHEDTIVRLTASSNIPSLSFNNSGDDPSGRWLASSSIDGNTMIWDLHEPGLQLVSSSTDGNKKIWDFSERARQMKERIGPVLTVEMGWCASATDPLQARTTHAGQCRCYDATNYPHGAWGALFLSTYAAYELSQAEEEILGLEQEKPHFKKVNGCEEWFTVKRYGANYTVEKLKESDDSSLGTEDFTADDAMVISGDESEDEAASETDDVNLVASVLPMMRTDDINMPVFKEQAEDIEADDLEANEVATDGADADEEDSENIEDHEEESDSTGSEEEALTGLGNIEDGSSGIWLPSLPSILSPETAKLSFCSIQVSQHFTPPPQSPLGPLLVITKEDVFLIQRPFSFNGHSHDNQTFDDAVLCLRHPLHLDGRHRGCASNRMCYFAQIPELGLFLVGSPIGRVAVFSIYWTKREGVQRPQYGFNLEYVLPFNKNDDREIRDYGKRMVGFAVGPLQGMFDRKPAGEGAVASERVRQSRRWRLLMHYADHTVISFELSRPRGRGSPSVEELVV